MNIFKKIWIAVTELFPLTSDEKVVSTVEKVWEGSEEKNEVIEIVRGIDNNQSNAKTIATINQIEKEIELLEDKKEKINERLAKISEIEIINDLTEINKSLNRIKQIIETKSILPTSRFFLSDPQAQDNLLRKNNLLNQFKEREEARKKNEALHRKQIRSKLDIISTFITQNKLEEVKLLITQIQKQINNSDKHEQELLSNAQQRLEEKELQILKRKQEEAQRKRDEEAKRLREIEEKELQAKAELELLLEKKHNWREFQQVLQQNRITTLYHFTDRENINSIKEHGGLYSWDYCDKHNIKIQRPGGGALSKSLDRQYSLQDYVRVSFTRSHPMMFVAIKDERILDPVILEINVDVCYFQETRFANMNATRTGHIQGKDIQHLQNIHFKTVKLLNHFNSDESEKPYYQAEILVKTWIPINCIKNINDF